MGTTDENRSPGNKGTAWDHPEASSVVTGPVGWSKLRDPGASGPPAADVSELAEIEPDLGSDPARDGEASSKS